jgi:hypothetical protein
MTKIPCPMHPVSPVSVQMPEMLPGIGLVTPSLSEPPDVRVPFSMSTLSIVDETFEMVIVKIPVTKPSAEPFATNVAVEVKEELKHGQELSNPETSKVDPPACIKFTEKLSKGVPSGKLSATCHRPFTFFALLPFPLVPPHAASHADRVSNASIAARFFIEMSWTSGRAEKPTIIFPLQFAPLDPDSPARHRR